MFGVSNYAPKPPALKVMLQLLKLKLPTVLSTSIAPDSDVPSKFIVVERVGGTDTAHGYISAPMFAFQCYASNTAEVEELCEQVLAILRSAQFTKLGTVQLRYFNPVGLPQNFPDPKVPGMRRWQFSGTFSMN